MQKMHFDVHMYVGVFSTLNLVRKRAKKWPFLTFFCVFWNF